MTDSSVVLWIYPGYRNCIVQHSIGGGVKHVRQDILVALVVDYRFRYVFSVWWMRLIYCTNAMDISRVGLLSDNLP